MRKLYFLLLASLFISCSHQPDPHHKIKFSSDITAGDIHAHVLFLGRDNVKNRPAGSTGAAIAARYISDQFHHFNLQPFGDDSTYYQQFTIDMSLINDANRPDTTASSDTKHIARNIIGAIKGNKMPDTYILIGSRYNRTGPAKTDSLRLKSFKTYHSTENGASGTAGLLELAQYFSSHPPQKSLLFIAFSGEETGLSGTQYFTDHPPVSLDHIEAMIGIGPIGQLNGNTLTISGTNSSPEWAHLIKKIPADSLKIKMISDKKNPHSYASFYQKNIPVLTYSTDTALASNNSPNDADSAHFKNEEHVLNHLKQLVGVLDTLSTGPLSAARAPVLHHYSFDGPTLGILPDYKFGGTGLRITKVRPGGPAAKAGLQPDDIIIQLDNKKLKDIYEYMDILNSLKGGQRTTVTVKRGNQHKTFEVKFSQ